MFLCYNEIIGFGARTRLSFSQYIISKEFMILNFLVAGGNLNDLADGVSASFFTKL